MSTDGVGGEPGKRHAAGDEPGGLDQVCAGAAPGGEDGDGRGRAVGAAEGLGEFQDAVDVGAAEGVDRLVRVTEGDQGAPAARSGHGGTVVAGERPHQPDLGGVGVLVLVHVDGVVGLGELPGGLGPLGEQDGAVDELGVVEGALRVEQVEIFGEEGGGGGPVGAAAAPGELGERVGAEAEFPGAGEDGADLVGEAAGGEAGAQFVGPVHAGAALASEFDLSGEQFADGDVLLGSGEQPQGFGEEVGVLVGADQGVAEGVEGGGARRGRGGEPLRHAVPQVHGGAAAEGEDQDAFGWGARGEAGGDGLDQGGGLAGARAGEDEQRSRPMVNHGPLGCVQSRGLLRHGAERTSRYVPEALCRACC